MVVVPYDPSIYSGSAPHYRPGRPPYSPQLEATLEDALDLDGRGRLLDVGCGPGILALRLAPLFEEVVALDPDADMLEEARRFASEAGVDNVGFVRGLAEELPEVAPAPFRLVTFGQSFHWTDEWHVAEAVFDLLEPGGAVAMVAHTVEGRPEPPDPGYPRIPHDALRALVAEYLGTRPRSGQGYVKPRDHRFEDVLVTTRSARPSSCMRPGSPICCETPRASSPDTCPSRRPRPTSSGTDSTSSASAPAASSPRSPLRGSSGTGLATRRSSSPAGRVESGFPIWE